MKVEIKLTGHLYKEIIEDLTRLHPFAAERVGFVLGRSSSFKDGRLLILTRYHSVPDDEYIEDPRVGARIGRSSLTWAMQAVYHGRPIREGIFHVHLHHHKGETKMSSVDVCEIPKLIPGFQSVGREAPHGIIILSLNHGSAWIWLPGKTEPVCADRISVIGTPICIFNRKDSK